MTKHEARTILHACRPSGGDADDSRIADARAFAARDPELKAWFEEWQAMDRAIAARLKAAPTLPESLLREVRIGAMERATARRIRFSRPLALAACLVLLGVLAGSWWLARSKPQPNTGIAALRADLTDFLQEFPTLELETDRLPEVEQWMATHHAAVATGIPTGFKPFPTLGCRTMKWRDTQVALVCFVVDGEVVHLFMLPVVELPELRDGAAPQYARAGRFTTAAWASGGVAFVAITPGNPETLDKVL